LPETRNAAVGLRLQATLARYQFIAESRYDSGEAFAHERSGVPTTFSAVARLDASRSIRVSGARAFDGGRGRTALTFSFVHRFGVPGGSFGLAKLFGFGKRRIGSELFATSLASNQSLQRISLVRSGVQYGAEGKAEVRRIVA
jgi:hypothetical protein